MRRRRRIGSRGGRRVRCEVLVLLALSTGPGATLASSPPPPAEIVLTGSPAAAPVLASVLADLRRTPLRHTVHSLSCEDRAACEAWLEPLSDPGPAGVDRILAVLDLDLADSGGALLRATPARRGQQLVFPPGWLVHALLRSAGAVGRPLAFAGVRHPLLAQLVARAAAPVTPRGASGPRRSWPAASPPPA